MNDIYKNKTSGSEISISHSQFVLEKIMYKETEILNFLHCMLQILEAHKLVLGQLFYGNHLPLDTGR